MGLCALIHTHALLTQNESDYIYFCHIHVHVFVNLNETERKKKDWVCTINHHNL